MSREGAERESKSERISSRLQALSFQHRAQQGAQTHESRDHDLSQMLNPLSHPGTSKLCFLKTCSFSFFFFGKNVNMILIIVFCGVFFFVFLMAVGVLVIPFHSCYQMHIHGCVSLLPSLAFVQF